MPVGRSLSAAELARGAPLGRKRHPVFHVALVAGVSCSCRLSAGTGNAVSFRLGFKLSPDQSGVAVRELLVLDRQLGSREGCLVTAARVGLLWRGERGTPMSSRVAERLGTLFTAFAKLDVSAEAVVYADDAIQDVRAELLALDGVLVWVNPIEDGATRGQLDALLREVAEAGVWVSAHPDVIDMMGTKQVLFTTRSLGWGSDTAIYYSHEELLSDFPARLGQHRRLVVKQARGTGGDGVWRVELPAGADAGEPELDASVLIQRSAPRDVTPLQERTLGSFLDQCQRYFAWSNCLIDQPYQERLAEGMIRVYFVHDEVVGFCHQWPMGLLTPNGSQHTPAATAAPAMEDPETPSYASLRTQAETKWVPSMQSLLGIATHDLPAIWDADFLYGPKTDSSDDTYVLCEINAQAVWPYPTQASARLAQAAMERVLAAKSARP